MQQLNRTSYSGKSRVLKVIQFGGGNFLRAFAGAMIQRANDEFNFNGNIAVVEYMGAQLADTINQQQGLYQLVLQGLVDGKASRETSLIDSITLAVNPQLDFIKFLALAAEPQARYIISNTTEAGITFDAGDSSLTQPGKSFPAKLTQLLYARYQIYKGAKDKGFIILPCELIEDNGVVLKQICLQYASLWQLENNFVEWLNSANYFCSTLVDRIVTGFPKEDKALLESLPYADNLVVVAEPYYSWVISGAEQIREELIFNQAQFNVKLVDDLAPYRQLKVRLLNAVHTALVPVAYLKGINEVRLAIEDKSIADFVERLIYREIIPTLEVSESEAHKFANEVLQRFANPYIVHLLMSIALNSIAKFVARDLPIIKDYQARFNKIPPALALGLAALLVFYRGKRGTSDIALNDGPEILEYCSRIWGNDKLSLENKVRSLLGNQQLWGEDLSLNSALFDLVRQQVVLILDKGIQIAVEGVIN